MKSIQSSWDARVFISHGDLGQAQVELQEIRAQIADLDALNHFASKPDESTILGLFRWHYLFVSGRGAVASGCRAAAPAPPVFAAYGKFFVSGKLPPHLRGSTSASRRTWYWLSLITTLRQYLEEHILRLRHRGRILNQLITAILRSRKTPSFLQQLVVIESAWFLLHGTHPPHGLRLRRSSGVDQELTGRCELATS